MYKKGVNNMTLREYRPIDANHKIAKGTIDQTEDTFNYLWISANLKPHHCLRFNTFTLIKSNEIQDKTIISVKNPDKLHRDRIIKTYPKQFQSEIKELHKKLNLTQRNLENLKKAIESEEVKQLSIEKQITFLKEKAYEIRTETNNNNFIKSFENRYSKLNEYLDERLKDLDAAKKNEIKNLLMDLKNRIDEVNPYLI